MLILVLVLMEMEIECGVIDDKGNEIFADKIGSTYCKKSFYKYKKSKFIVDVKSTGLYLKDKILLKMNVKQYTGKQDILI